MIFVKYFNMFIYLFYKLQISDFYFKDEQAQEASMMLKLSSLEFIIADILLIKVHVETSQVMSKAF